ncbi:hypothetical protein IE81DRAFT_124612 [Ceraceosorus guamensis]|uniref:Uncharacterized protein n=1 Tax=Ceraceosorus guamensis TaxID=1522189 RepID=A0A316VXX9_9BASI|nr:hypothetical protein IE81DRAFT_124612 [Ceraceosorus guamensis]PWN42486.1 hypothetical protein IE81DRAFT_124612 [Ceraceosorus guamensis]
MARLSARRDAPLWNLRAPFCSHSSPSTSRLRKPSHPCYAHCVFATCARNLSVYHSRRVNHPCKDLSIPDFTTFGNILVDAYSSRRTVPVPYGTTMCLNHLSFLASPAGQGCAAPRDNASHAHKSATRSCVNVGRCPILRELDESSRPTDEASLLATRPGHSGTRMPLRKPVSFTIIAMSCLPACSELLWSSDPERCRHGVCADLNL